MSHDERAKTGSRKRLLIVDDDALMSALYRSIFRRHAAEFACEFERSGEAALERLGRESFDAVIMDWDLGGMSGLETLKAIRADPGMAELCVFLITGRFDAESEELAFGAGVDDYASKPFAIDDLLARLRAFFQTR
ncbi:MAG: response regulator transcription factor [Elusimicrobia bacterium]|nr:response regulator transcription factor [Elusimicrobiota bacterium]